VSTRYLSAALAASTLLALTPAAGGAWAAPAEESVTQKLAVSFADLNLSSAEGQAILAARIHRAAQAVCGPEPDPRDLAQLPSYRRCMKQSVDAAVAAIPAASHMAGSGKPAG
jgi:UrcA family protein